ncbi:unnamed protein product [Arabidopsis halleri]
MNRFSAAVKESHQRRSPPLHPRTHQPALKNRRLKSGGKGHTRADEAAGKVRLPLRN